MNKMKLEKQEKNEVLPIEDQLIRGKIKHILVTIPALDERWALEKKFAFYVFPPTKLKNGSYVPGAKDTWIASMSYVLNDIWWLCELPYHKFWSQIIYHKNSVNGIKSFLHLAPLQKLYYRTNDSDILFMYKRIKKAVFQFLKRITRPKESELHFMSDSKYREILSDSDIIPISLLFCICSVYGEKYRENVHSVVSQIFQWNKNLKLEQAVLRTIQLFDHLNKKLKASYKELKKNLLCSDDSSDVSDAANAYRSCLLATVQFLANASLNVSNFLSVYKDGCQMFLNHDFDFHIIRVYNKLLIPLYQEINILFQDCHQTQTFSWLNSLIDVSRLELSKSFEICLQTTLGKMGNSRISQDFIQRYVKLMKFVLKTEEFMQDLNAYCNIVDTINRIKKKCPGNLDVSDVDRVTEMVNEFVNKNGHESPTEKRISPDIDCEYIQWNEIIDYVKEYYDSDEGLYSGSENVYANGVDDIFFDDHQSDGSNWSDDEDSNSEYESYLAGSDDDFEKVLPAKVNNSNERSTVAQQEKEINSKFAELSLQPVPSTSNSATDTVTLSLVQLQSAITHVKDFLPHLGDGFVAMCLDFYKMDPSAVINAILEETLPPCLKTLDHSLSHITDEIHLKLNSLLQNEETCDNKLKVLKKPEYSSYHEMFNDKKEIRDVKKVYESYRNIEEDVLYDDDVDEEFDEAPIAALEVNPEGFYNEYAKIPLRNFNRPQKPANFRVSDDELEEKDGEPENQLGRPKSLDFCENPEITRARREHQRRVADERKHRKTSYSNNNSYGKNRREPRDENSENEKFNKPSQDDRYSHEGRPPRNNDGENVSHERHFKNVHKSRNANHNRRFLSDRKRKF